jgi:two-component system response regulator HydG
MPVFNEESHTDPGRGIVPRTKSEPPEPERHVCVIVADDDDDVREVVATILRCDGYDVHEAHDGAEALALAQTHHADLFVSDVRMPRVDGLDLVERLRELGSTTPVVLMTAYNAKAPPGVYAIFHKPFEVDDLRTAVMNAIR